LIKRYNQPRPVTARDKSHAKRIDFFLRRNYQQSGAADIKSSFIRILVVDDFEPWHRFVSTLLQNEPSLKIVGQAFDGSEAIQKTRALEPDLILLDIGLPRLNGLEAARQMREHSPNATILFCSEHRSPEIVEAALETGALGYIGKRDAASELLPAVETVLRGKVFISSSLIGADPESEHQAGCEKVASRFPIQSIESSRHKLTLCPDDSAFVDDFAHSIETALENGNAVLVVTTESHRADLQHKLRANGVDVDTVAERNLYISIDVPDSLWAAVDTSTDEDGFPNGVRHAIVEVLRAAKERHLHLAVG